MASYNVALPPQGYQFSEDYMYSSSQYILSPTGTTNTNVAWTKDENNSDSVDLDIDYLNTTTQNHLSFSSDAFPVIDNVHYEHAFFLVRLSNGTIRLYTGTLQSSSSTYTYEAWIQQTVGSAYPYTLFCTVHKRRSYTVTFDLNGGTGDFPNVTFLSGKTFTLPTDEPTKEGFYFQGWLYDGSLYQAGETSPVLYTSDTLVAQWTDVPPIPPPPSGVSDTLAYLPTTGALAFRRDTNFIVYNT